VCIVSTKASGINIKRLYQGYVLALGWERLGRAWSLPSGEHDDGGRP